MPKLAVPLNDTKIKALKPKAKRYLVADGGGLVLSRQIRAQYQRPRLDYRTVQ